MTVASLNICVHISGGSAGSTLDLRVDEDDGILALRDFRLLDVAISD